ncbi:MAG: prenyltransferase/squalene oxidase repeat-containing protein [Thermoanaerobaculia bacterium]
MTTVSGRAGAGIPAGDLFPPEVERATTAAATALQRLQERWPRVVELSIASQPSIYHSYPYIFLGAFPTLAGSGLEPLCLAASLFADSLFVADDVMDEDPSDRDTTTNLVRLQAMQFEGYRILHGLFPPQAPFWDRFRDYLALYAQACIDEKRFALPAADWSELSQELALRIAKGKSSLAKFVVAGLVELAGDDAPLEPLTRALDRYYIARQMLDDLSDWRQDLARGFPSLLLTRVAAAEFAGESKEELARQPERTGRAIYLGGHARYTVLLALHALAEAGELVAPFPDLLWCRVTAKLRGRCETLLAELERIAAAGGERRSAPQRVELSLPAPDDAWQEMAWGALGFLLRRWQADPPGEARSRHAAQGGGLLVRAQVAGALCDADEELEGQLRPLIEGQAKVLLEHRLRSRLGGWSWSAVSPGLPADADHLGTILGLLARLGWRSAAEEHCEPALAVLLERQGPDGALPTWIGGDDDPPGGGPDEAVVARLLTALDLYDRERFSHVVDRGTAWIEARQGSDGSWTSPGVKGPYLPAAAGVELLAAVRPGSPSLGRAAAFLRGSQGKDGGWGIEAGQSDAVSTALALLALARLQPLAGEEKDARRARHGLGFLLATVSFEAVPPSAGGTLTAAFLLQAAIAWHRLEKVNP